MRLPEALTKYTPRDRQFWRRLTRWERKYLVGLMTARSSGYGGGGYLPDDCSECGYCGQPVLGSGLCGWCSKAYVKLWDKASEAVRPV